MLSHKVRGNTKYAVEVPRRRWGRHWTAVGRWKEVDGVRDQGTKKERWGDGGGIKARLARPKGEIKGSKSSCMKSHVLASRVPIEEGKT
jgi:hypothetical protein